MKNNWSLLCGILVTVLSATLPFPLRAQDVPAKDGVEENAATNASPTKSAQKTVTAEASVVEKGDELQAIRRASAEFVNAFNQHDYKSLAEMWTVDGDYVDETGTVYAGREAIADEYQKFFAVNDDIKMHVAIDSIRLLNGTAAIEDGRAYLFPEPAGAPGHSRYTAVHVKVDGKWLMSSVRDARVATPTGYHNISDLEWLIGTWTAEENGAKVESVCQWVANKSFVERKYTVTRHDNSTLSGIQLIGFNPQGGHVQSWDFSSDGGHAVGVWTPRDGGWQAEVNGMTGDGVSTYAVNLLTRIDDNAYAWQSVRRVAGKTSLPDTDEVIIRRQTKDAQ